MAETATTTTETQVSEQTTGASEEKTPTVEELIEWIQKSGKELKKWFNTSGLKYKELNLKDKLVTMSDKEKIELLASDGMLIKRPLLITDEKILIGFKEDKWKETLK